MFLNQELGEDSRVKSILKKENQLAQITKKREDQEENDMNLLHFLYRESTQIVELNMQKTEDALLVLRVDRAGEVNQKQHSEDLQRVFLIVQDVRDSLDQKLFDSSSPLHGSPSVQYVEVL